MLAIRMLCGCFSLFLMANSFSGMTFDFSFGAAPTPAATPAPAAAAAAASPVVSPSSGAEADADTATPTPTPQTTRRQVTSFAQLWVDAHECGFGCDGEWWCMRVDVVGGTRWMLGCLLAPDNVFPTRHLALSCTSRWRRIAGNSRPRFVARARSPVLSHFPRACTYGRMRCQRTDTAIFTVAAPVPTLRVPYPTTGGWRVGPQPRRAAESPEEVVQRQAVGAGRDVHLRRHRPGGRRRGRRRGLGRRH